jgi:hypothetical protein
MGCRCFLKFINCVEYIRRSEREAKSISFGKIRFESWDRTFVAVQSEFPEVPNSQRQEQCFNQTLHN